VIHLKRFHLVNNRWVKSNKLVRFPFDQFNPTVHVPQSARGGGTSCPTPSIIPVEPQVEKQDSQHKITQVSF